MMKHISFVIIAILLGATNPAYAQNTSEHSTEVNEIKIMINEMNDEIINLKNNINAQEIRTQEKLSNILENLVEIQHNIERYEQNMKEIKKYVEKINEQIEEVKNSNTQCKINFDCEKIIQSLDQVNTSLEGIISVIDKNNYTNLIIIAISLVLAGTAITVSIVTTRKAVEQVDQTKKEQKHRLRPILVREEYFNFNDDGLKRPHRVMENKIMFRIKNIGPLATTKVSMRWYVAIIQNQKYEFLRSSDEDYPIEGRPLPNLENNEAYSIDLFINKIHYEHIKEKTNCVFGVILEYFNEKNRYEYRMEGYFDYGGELMLLSKEEMEKMISLMMKK